MSIISTLRLRFAFHRLKRDLKKNKTTNYGAKDIMALLFSKRFSLIRPWQYEEEFLSLLNHYQKMRANYVMEIGTANGGTLFAHCKLASDNATLISVDLPGGKFGGGYPDWKVPIYSEFAKKDQNLHLIRANSHTAETVNRVREILNGNYLDYLFIDGDHTYEGVKKDYDLYSPLVRAGGSIIFHDIAYHKNSSCEVDKFWRDVKGKSQAIEFIKDKEVGQFGIGILIK